MSRTCFAVFDFEIFTAFLCVHYGSGELALLHDNTRRTATIIAEVDSGLVKIDAPDFKRIIKHLSVFCFVELVCSFYTNALLSFYIFVRA